MFTFILLLPLYLMPTIIAVLKKHPYKVPIILINVIGGLIWGLGWLVALVWCFIDAKKENVVSNNNIADELSKLHELLEKGILTQEEFNAKKQSLINS